MGQGSIFFAGFCFKEIIADHSFYGMFFIHCFYSSLLFYVGSYPWEINRLPRQVTIYLEYKSLDIFYVLFVSGVLQDSQAGRDGVSMFGEGGTGAQVDSGMYILLL